MSATEESIAMATTAAHAAVKVLATNVAAIDVSEQLVITDIFLIASADNERQVNSIVEEVEDALRETGHQPLRREGTREGRWALLDYGTVVIHVQHDDERDFYGLERLWKDCPLIEIDGIEPAVRPEGDRDDEIVPGSPE
ncbi:ribosome silencing factor [Gordonia sp. HY002]|uniref:ribosome silencing factor n=1 Tax=Gordonia zhenghanii TaxID=2911516 RepID=UPI001EF0E89D|nr:ribosome silencing factor [Gordonia zhenghanii]MCF8572296.1 ribosome silencing factor [Gordonia zhenghanii]MCF8605997.1 ribosome silencing factor [Gordonia zhenghanii]